MKGKNCSCYFPCCIQETAGLSQYLDFNFRPGQLVALACFGVLQLNVFKSSK